MASVTSLGLHQPTALEYAIQEQILPENPSSSLYTWEIIVDHEPGNEGEDELLVTKDTVIWSRGSIFRKSYGFKLEKEPITQALLTYFPNSEQDSKSPTDDDGVASEPTDELRPLAKALVVFLKTQAHIYFLQGTSHVVHIPFEVESACAAPQGVIIQRKQTSDISLAASLKFPKVPPNSFISSQISPSSMRTSQQMTFTTETLGRPKALPLRLSTNVDTVWDVPTAKNDSHWPRLVSLTDPLLEIGLVVTKPDASTRRKGYKGSTRPPHVLDPAEEILHIEELPQPIQSSKQDNNKLILAITINRETSMYTVWRFSFIRHEDPFLAGRKKTRRKSDRRRSSMQPGLPSGATSPIQTNFKESFGTTLPGKRARKSEKVDKTDRALENLESSLGIDRDTGLNRRSSRRVSSMLARADLSASQDRTNFVDQSQTSEHPNTRRHTSHNSQRNRNSGVSFSGNYGHGHGGNSLVTFLEAPVDNLLEELQASGDLKGFHNMGLDDHDFDGLAQEIMLTKVHSIPVDNSNVRYSLSKQPARKQCKVFCLAGPPSTTDGHMRRQVLIGIQDLMEKRLQLLILHVQSNMADEKATVNVGKLTKAQNVIDSCKIVDRSVSKLLVLSESHEGQRALSVQAPWSDWKNVTLPPKLSLASLRSLDYRGSLVNREMGIRRAVTPVIGEIAGIRHPKLRGVVDILDEDTNQLHQIRIQLEPTSPQVTKVLSILHAALPVAFGENLLVIWWNALDWLRSEDIECTDIEWSAVVILIMSVYLVLGTENVSPPEPSSIRRRTRSFLRSSSGTQVDLSDWEAMNSYEAPNSSTHPVWAEGTAWQWMLEQDDTALTMFHPNSIREDSGFLVSHVKHALSCLSSAYGEKIVVCLPTAPHNDVPSKTQHARDVFVALHLLLEEQKLDTSSSQTSSPGPVNLRAVLLQVAQWMKWEGWLALYELEMPLDWLEHRPRAPVVTISLSCPEPTYWSALDWISTNLTQEKRSAEMIATIPENMSSRSLPRILMFKRLLEILNTGKKSPVEFVEAMHESGVTTFILETLPEAVVVPLRDAIVQCQGNPPSTWSRNLLDLVNRGDVGAVFSSSSRHTSHTSHIPVSLIRNMYAIYP